MAVEKKSVEVKTKVKKDTSKKKVESSKKKSSPAKKINSKKSEVTSKKKKTVKTSEEVIIKQIPKEEKEEIILPKNNLRYYLLLIIVLLLGLIYLMIPKITVLGDKVVTMRYYEEYVESGYKGKWLFKNITPYIIVTSNLDNTKIGEYAINYQFKFGFFNLNKKRIIVVIDDVDPMIILESNTINICPNDMLPDIKYEAIDEYDGDITDRVIINTYEDKILLAVSDNSKNTTGEEITVDRTDRESPKIELKGRETMYLNVGSSYREPGYTATDKCDGDLTDKVEVSGDVSSSAGEYTKTYTVSDSAGNKSEVTRKIVVRNYNLYNSGSIGNGVIYLTFDDGPNEGTTNVILDILKDEGIKATFFVTCKGPDYLIKRIYDEGHTVALHTCSHDYSEVYASVDNYFNDLDRISDRVKRITGYDAKIIRFPGGSSNTVSRSYSYGIMSTLTGMVLDKGYRYFDWNVDSNDAGGAGSSSQVYNNVINGLSHSRSNVILMHDIKYTTRDALRDIIEYGKSEGYLFGKLENDTYMIRHSVNN